jgi:ABC-type transport system involved in multi-copper enzyme maturation permease subunit
MSGSRTCRRWQVYAGRALFVGVLLAGLSSVWVSQASGRTSLTIQAMAGVGLRFFRAIAVTQLTLVILAAPAATAGAICQDRSSGKLRQLLATDLTDSEIMLGKVASVTALVEERARGSLDVLLATPLSTRSIVLAKWWGAFRELPRLLALPVGVAAMIAWRNDRWQLLGMLFLFIISAAAFWTSVGLALSTWVSRLGRAISSAVILYVLIALGWPMLTRTLFWGPVGAGLWG